MKENSLTMELKVKSRATKASKNFGELWRVKEDTF